MKFIILAFLSIMIALSSMAKANETLTVVQTVSNNRRTFVLQKGIKDGFSKGQEIIFSNENASIVCKAQNVTREYSLWEPVDKNITIPFNKQDIISLNTHAFGNVGVNVAGIVSSLIPEDIINKEYFALRNENNITFRYSYGAALSQSASSVGAAENSKKKGQDYSLEYGFRISPEFEIAIGGRLDYENYRLTTPELDIPTERKFATLSMIYHFVNYSSNKNNIYASVTLGVGTSSTTVDDEINSGMATLLPQVRLGYMVPFSRTMAFVTEASVESLSSHEEVATGSKQDTSQVNAKISFGIRF